jgi:hypothetical protein
MGKLGNGCIEKVEMALIRPRLNDHYELAFTQEEVDFAIPFLDDDIPLYVDSFLLWKRLKALSTLTVLRRTRAVDELVEAFLSTGALPAKAKADAAHLAFATSHQVDYLLTWNCKHLANAVILSRLRPVAEQHGYRMPIVCRPLQLMGEIEYEG